MIILFIHEFPRSFHKIYEGTIIIDLLLILLARNYDNNFYRTLQFSTHCICKGPGSALSNTYPWPVLPSMAENRRGYCEKRLQVGFSSGRALEIFNSRFKIQENVLSDLKNTDIRLPLVNDMHIQATSGVIVSVK